MSAVEPGPERTLLGPLADYPFTSRFTRAGGCDLHYVDEGPRGAPALLMVHGNPTWSYFFRSLIGALRPRYRCIALDHVGMGLSSRPPAKCYAYTLERRIEDLESLRAALGLERFTLVVHDWGGAIGLGLAVRDPARVERLIVMNTAAYTLPPGLRVAWQLRLARSLLGWPLVVGLNAVCRGAARYCAASGLSPEVRRAYLAPYRTPRQRLAVLRFVQDIPWREGHPSFATLRAIESDLPRLRSVPAVIVWGMRDFVFTPAFLELWRRHLPQADIHRFHHAGHYLLEDAPDAVAEVVADFLARRGPAA